MLTLLERHRGARQLMLAAPREHRHLLLWLAYKRDISDCLDTRVLAGLGAAEHAAIAAMLERTDQPTAYDTEVGEWLTRHVTPSATVLQAMRRGGPPPIESDVRGEYAQVVQAVAGCFVVQYDAFVADFEAAPLVTTALVCCRVPHEPHKIIFAARLTKSAARGYASAETRTELSRRFHALLVDVHPHLMLHFPALGPSRRPLPTYLSLQTNLLLRTEMRPPPEPDLFPVDWARLEQWPDQWESTEEDVDWMYN